MNHSRYTILVAEDEELLLNNLVQKINNFDLEFEVICTAHTGAKALTLAQEFMPDLIITDIKMPLLTGLELLEQVHHILPYTQFIITSGFSDFEYTKKAIRLQVIEYLLKPIDSDELYNALLIAKNKLDLENNRYSDIFNTATSRTSPEHTAYLLKEYIVHNLDIDINLNLIAQNMNYSPSYLTQLFIQYYNISPIKYLIALRIEKSKHLLLHNLDLSIREIGEIIGYPEQSYFSRIFKKHVGISPFNYREKYINSVSKIGH